ncbi:MAG: MBOAT family protein [Clostridia bacterium]|nr:MBOAT family protein [Clostridia bacterium]
MLFSTPIFLIWFLPIVLFGYYVLFRRWRPAQNVFLLAASLVFYAWGEPKFVFVMIGSIAFNWLMGLLTDRFRARKTVSRVCVGADVAGNLGLLFVFKYLMFTLQNVNTLFGASLTVPKITLPIGISFFTFQAMSYVLDVYRGDGAVQKNPLYVGLYISLFPQLIAGPIVRYQTVADEIRNRRETWPDFADGVQRFMVGFLKKVLLANTMGVIADGVFDSKDPVGAAASWLGLIAYTLQIYYDFSGYSDMGIGLGRMFGFHFLENFNYPYISTSVTEFWRRWHISLGTWFRDYVYIPLGGSRVKKPRLVLNLFVVWFLTGVWHGANWTFVVWGLLYFVLLTVEKLTGVHQKLRGKAWLPVKYLCTMLFVCLGWLVFRADDMPAAWTYFRHMLGMGVSFSDQTFRYYIGNYFVYLLAAAVLALPVAPWLRRRVDALAKKPRAVCEWVYIAGLCALFLVSIANVVKGSYNPFIYFNF